MATIREIAKTAGVSIGTVDRVLHNRGRVSKETQAKIEAIVEEIHYKPNVFARNLSLAKTFIFGILMPKPHQDSRYWEISVCGMNKAQQELESHKVKTQYFYYNRYSESSFKNAAKEALNSQCDGLLIAPVFSRMAKKFVETIPADLPFAFFDSNIPNTKYITYIGQDPFRSGFLSAKLMDMLIRDSGQIAVIRVLPEDFHINDRARGFRDYYQKHPLIHVRTVDIEGSDDQNYFHTFMESLLKEMPNLKGIFVTNARTHQVAEEIESAGLGKHISIIGYDLVKKNIDYLKKGVIDFLISQVPEQQGYRGLYALYRHVVLKETIENKMTIPLDIITRENIDDYQRQ